MGYFDNLFIIKSKEETGNGFAFKLQCNPSHPVYQAHFPGNPITPGACLLQTAVGLFQQIQGREVCLKNAKSIKFINVLVPSEGKEIQFVFSQIENTGADIKVQVVVEDENLKYSKMSLTFGDEIL